MNPVLHDLDEARRNKPLTARLFPVPGKKAGDKVRWPIPHLVPWFRVMDLK